MFVKHNKIIALALCPLFIMGLFVAGNGKVLCIGDDGHIELETSCLPCCGDETDICVSEPSDDMHEEHNDCSNCSDIEIDSPLWSKRLKHISLTIANDIRPEIAVGINVYPTSVNDNPSQLMEFHISSGKNKPSHLFLTAVLRC